MGNAGGKGSAASSTTVLADPEFRYYPLWDVRENEIFGYLCEGFWDLGDGEPVPENALREAFSDSKRLLALDLETLRKSTEQVEEVVERYGFMKVLIPVHFATLAAAESSSVYLEACNKSVWTVLDYVFFEIVRPPEPLPRNDLASMVEQIRPYGGGIMLRVDPGFDGFDAIPADGVLSVGLDLRGVQLGEREIMSELERFAGETSAHGLRSHVHGLQTVTTSVAAVSAGFDFIGSDDIAPALDNWNPDDDKVKPIDLLKTLLASKQG